MKLQIKLNQYIKMTSLGLVLFASSSSAQYSVGQTISQVTRDKVVSYCANGDEDITLGNLLVPGVGEPTRVVFLNFFESW